MVGYTTQAVQKEREEDGDSVYLDALEIMAATPQLLFARQTIHQNRYTNEGDRALDTASEFNERIRNFAAKYPEIRVERLEAALQSAANVAIKGRSAREQAALGLHEVIRGAQHELAFRQLVLASGRECLSATRQQDRRGIDHAIRVPGGDWYFVDTKASLNKVERKGSDRVFAVVGHRQVMMLSMVSDQELKGRFQLSEKQVQEKMAAFEETMQSVERVVART